VKIKKLQNTFKKEKNWQILEKYVVDPLIYLCTPFFKQSSIYKAGQSEAATWLSLVSKYAQ